ncbi:MAG: hypothetical protein DRO10_02460 [Thermoprotei archaeon]|nr:MAG: hypothetical protein DRO10_02460 [Thermoprotei archaeon]
MKAIIMDIDGTMVNTTLNWGEMRAALERLLGTKLSSEPVASQLLKIPPEKLREVERTIHFYEKESIAGVSRDDELYDIIKRLREAGLKIGVVTLRSRDTAEPLLKALGLMELIDCLITREDSLYRRDQLKIALEQLGVSTDDAVFIGDIEEDKAAGQVIGIETKIIRDKGDSPGVPNELKDILKNFLRNSTP